MGGTTGNSWFDLVFGRTGGYLGSAALNGQMSGDPGLSRIFNTALGGQISWLLPLALAGLVAGLWTTRRATRTDLRRAGYLLWGLWTVTMIAVFSFAQGTFHSYYTVLLAPGVAALAGAGSVELSRLGTKRHALSWLLPVVVAGSAVWSAVLLRRVSGYVPELAVAVIALGVAGATALAVSAWWRSGARPARIIAAMAGVLCAAALLAGPFAYDASTVARSVTGNAAAAGPGVATLTSITAPGSNAAAEPGVDQALLAYLREHRGGATYLVAVQTSSTSVPIILATGEPVVTIGGYKSRDPFPTAGQLASLVVSGELRYVLLSDEDMSSSAEGSESTQTALQATVDWVLAHGAAIAAAEYGGAADGTLYLVR